jgi:hypothetical protein
MVPHPVRGRVSPVAAAPRSSLVVGVRFGVLLGAPGLVPYGFRTPPTSFARTLGCSARRLVRCLSGFTRPCASPPLQSFPPSPIAFPAGKAPRLRFRSLRRFPNVPARFPDSIHRARESPTRRVSRPPGFSPADGTGRGALGNLFQFPAPLGFALRSFFPAAVGRPFGRSLLSCRSRLARAVE